MTGESDAALVLEAQNLARMWREWQASGRSSGDKGRPEAVLPKHLVALDAALAAAAERADGLEVGAVEWSVKSMRTGAFTHRGLGKSTKAEEALARALLAAQQELRMERHEHQKMERRAERAEATVTRLRRVEEAARTIFPIPFELTDEQAAALAPGMMRLHDALAALAQDTETKE